MPLKVFVDSDVVISLLLSQSGAAFLLLRQTGRDHRIDSPVLAAGVLSSSLDSALIPSRFGLSLTSSTPRSLRLEEVEDVNARVFPFGINVKFFISNISKKEIEIVTRRLKIDKTKTRRLIKDHLNIIKIKEEVAELKVKFKYYTSDVNDAHIVAGAKAAKVKFIISYNIRDFNVERINKDLKISILTPANFLQYLRSQLGIYLGQCTPNLAPKSSSSHN